MRSTQRKMLRMVLQYPRKVVHKSDGAVELESWTEWTQRSTHAAEERLQNLNLRDWVNTHMDRTKNGRHD